MSDANEYDKEVKSFARFITDKNDELNEKIRETFDQTLRDARALTLLRNKSVVRLVRALEKIATAELPDDFDYVGFAVDALVDFYDPL